MTHPSANSSSTVDPLAVVQEVVQKVDQKNHHLRCRQRTLNGRRCRLTASDTSSGLCGKHLLARDAHIQSADLTLALTGEFSRFQSACQINDFLSKLQLLLAQKRITPRQAGVMAYISSLQLRTLPAIEHENNPYSDEDAPVQIILDGPRPIRD